MYKKILLVVGLSSCVLMLSGCATMFGDKGRVVSVNSAPPGAQVFLNGQPEGSSPATLTLAKVSDNYVTVKKSGYQATTQAIPTTFQKVGWWNILFWPGFIVDAISGDSMKLATTNMTIKMSPNTPSSK
ncbi:MAG: hypothetical protein K0R66_251 [Gammaproteobacteria bacterium]|jgi:hypothetical protein|nr:hypothetical protein [Gammaproteobacteria bacterium]